MSDKIFVASKVSQIITDKIIKKLEQGIVPWRQSWASSGLPVNWETKRPYSGVNLLILEPGAEYLTFNQIKKLGARLKKGAIPLPVVFWKVDTIETEKPDGQGEEIETVEETEKTVKTVYLLRYYLVYNIRDVEDLPKCKKQQERIQPDYNNKTQKALTIVKEWSKICTIKHGSNYTPSYCLLTDTIYMPTFDKFVGEHRIEEYFSTIFHEIIHSTGHKNRLNRIKHSRYGDWHYSLEELTAEIGSAMLLNVCGLDVPEEVFDNNVAYINYWLEQLRNDKTLIIKASGRAEKAVEYVFKAISTKQNLYEVQQATA